MNERPDRAPNSVWLLRREQFYPAVRTAGGDRIIIWDDSVSGWIEMSRKDARLLAKRLNQCLDDTAVR